MSSRLQIRSTLRGGRKYACGNCGQRFGNGRKNCPDCGGAVTGKR